MAKVDDVRCRPFRCFGLMAHHCMNKDAGLTTSCTRRIVVSCAQHHDCSSSAATNLLDQIRIMVRRATTEDTLFDEQGCHRTRLVHGQAHDRTVAGHDFTVHLACRILVGCDLARKGDPAKRRAQPVVLGLPLRHAVMALPGFEHSGNDFTLGLAHTGRDQLAAGVAAARLALTTVISGISAA